MCKPYIIPQRYSGLIDFAESGRFVVFPSNGIRVHCASFNTALNAIIIRNAQLRCSIASSLARGSLAVAPKRQMHVVWQSFRFVPSISRFAQIAHFDVALLIRKSRAGGRKTSARERHGLFRSRT